MTAEHLVKTRFQYLHLSNDVLLGNFIVNLMGSIMSGVFLYYRIPVLSDRFVCFFGNMEMILGVAWIAANTGIIIAYEWPVRQCLKRYHTGKLLVPDRLALARKRLLNEPYLIASVNVGAWTVICLVYRFLNIPNTLMVWISSGLTTGVLAFFWAEHVIQNNLVSFFFPHGGLGQIPGVWSMSLRARLGILIFVVSIVPLGFILLTISQFKNIQAAGQMSESDLLDLLGDAISMESLIFIAIAIFLFLMVSETLRRPVAEIILSLSRVIKGDFSARSRIFARDEIGFAGETLNRMTEGLKEKEFIRSTFGRYVGQEVRDEILKGDIPLDGELKQATLLFADLRDFTPRVENTPPNEMICILNAYLDEMTRCIGRHRGMVLQFIGDEIEAVFGAPLSLADHERAAVKAALDMRAGLEALNKTLRSQGYEGLNHGIGIHTGQVLAANIGSRERIAYSLIGDTVNTASRIQGLNKNFKTDILVSGDIAQKAGDGFEFVQMPRVRLKGKNKMVAVFSLVGAHSTQVENC